MHGDLHTGSLMCNKERTVAIDAEFAFYGPMFVDVGLLVGNMLLAVFSQTLYEQQQGERNEYVAYLCAQTVSFWKTFSEGFVELWVASEEDGKGGNLVPATMGDAEMRSAYRVKYVAQIWADSIKFAGAILIRRTLGIADAPEFRVGEERNKVRWAAEERAMRFGHHILNETVKSDSIEAVIDAMKQYL